MVKQWLTGAGLLACCGGLAVGADRAQRESTPTRERVSVNGMWRWQPAPSDADAVPAEGWGYFKVPGSWPGITDYMQKDSQTVHVHPSWQNTQLREVTAAWYQREITVPTVSRART
jgi:beta-galactosidase